MKRSNKILQDYYGKVYAAHGKEPAMVNLKGVIVKGLKILVEMPGVKDESSATSLVKKVRDGKPGQLVEEIAAEVQDGYKKTQNKYLLYVSLDKEKQPLYFLPDVEIPDTPDNRKKWHDFLKSVHPRCRRHMDPVTGLIRIPFRDGVWLYDLILPAEHPAKLIEDITDVAGNLVCLTPRISSPGRLRVQGDLRILALHLSRENNLVESLAGDMDVFDDSGAREADGLSAPPEGLLRWGLAPGRHLTINERKTYRFSQRGEEDDYVLAEIVKLSGEVVRGSIFAWRGGKWIRTLQELPMDLLNRVRVKLGKVCVFLGLGKQFINDHTDHTHQNLDKILALIGFLEGSFVEGGVKKLGARDRKLLVDVGSTLRAIKSSLTVYGNEDPEAIETIVEDVRGRLSELSDERLRRLKTIASQPKEPVGLAGMDKDDRYLRSLDKTPLTMDDLLAHAGRAVVFINNNCQSKEARARVKSKIGDLLTILREVVGTREADLMLVNMLKYFDEKMIKDIRRENKSHSLRISELSKRMKKLVAVPPRVLIEEVYTALQEAASPEAARDRELLWWMLEAEGRGVDELLAGAASPVDMIRRVLFVSLESFVYEDVKVDNPRIRSMSPEEIIGYLKDKLRFMEPVVKAYNQL